MDPARINYAATTIGNYAIFGGGSGYGIVEAYNDTLTHTSVSPLSRAQATLSAAATNDYALFGGGTISDVTAYNKSLVKTTVTSLYNKAEDNAATSVGGYVLFSGGYIGSWTYSSSVTTYNNNLT